MNIYALQNIVFSRERVKAGSVGEPQKAQSPRGVSATYADGAKMTDEEVPEKNVQR